MKVHVIKINMNDNKDDFLSLFHLFVFEWHILAAYMYSIKEYPYYPNPSQYLFKYYFQLLADIHVWKIEWIFIVLI